MSARLTGFVIPLRDLLLEREAPRGDGTVWIGARSENSDDKRTRLEPVAAVIISRCEIR